ncbi:MAG: DUF6402 family protein [Gammaproteobacteria bacterium]|nr:DUF6402 family protein [Gammaproteobacteria bacterium]
MGSTVRVKDIGKTCPSGRPSVGRLAARQVSQVSTLLRTGRGVPQAKLRINTPGDVFEQEADRVAEQIMRMPDPRLSLQDGDRSLDDQSLQPEPMIQRLCKSCAEDDELLQKKSIEGQGAPVVSAALSQSIRSLRGGGEPLPGAARNFFEPRFGVDLSAVRIHDNARADQLARSLSARAFTLGSDVMFARGEYSPSETAGRGLLAHELVHVLQQRSDEATLRRQNVPAPAPPASPAPPAFSITQIPGIMTAMSWNTAAALMNDWFSRPANAVPASGTPNTSAVTISWANGFSRARSVYDTLVADRIWVNDAAQNLLQSRLVGAGLPGHGASQAFGSVTGSAPALDSDYINYRAVNQGLFTALDGLAGALANFVYRVVVRGRITDTGASPWHAFGTSRSYQVDLSDVGIYIKDSYDFNGDQDLGCWDPVANTVGRTRLFQGNATCVGNVDYRTWRAANNRGGDFLIYSTPDVLSVSDSFTFYH